MSDAVPKVFLSYSWTNSDKVLELAERLMTYGVEVVLDKWELKEGQDKYVFMEQCVTNPDIDKVLLVCDKAYAEKADSRSGGVGDETTIISSEVYGKVRQEKFIPVIIELNEDGNPYLPTYIKSRIYVDLSAEDSNYEVEFEKLVRNIHNKPLNRKPKLGKMPDWLESDSIDLAPIRNTIKQMRRMETYSTNKIDYLIKHITDAFITALTEIKEIHIGDNDELLLSKIEQLRPVRDLFIEFLEVIISSERIISNTVTSWFEDVYNGIYEISGNLGYSRNDFEYYDFFMWETFISATAVLLHYEKYKELNEILCNTYFLRDSYLEGSAVKTRTFATFRKYFRTIEEICKPKSPESRLYTLSGKMLMERELKPILTAKNLARADVVLYQLSTILVSKVSEELWFPTSYIYCKDIYTLWTRLKSKKFCEKLLPLFGVESIEKLKEILSQLKTDDQIRYQNSFDFAPNIINCISVEEIATVN